MNEYTFLLTIAGGDVRVNVTAEDEPRAWRALLSKIELADSKSGIWLPRSVSVWVIANVREVNN